MTDFKITGPGLYRTRDGRKVEVKKIDHSLPLYPVIGRVYPDDEMGAWPINGMTGEGNEDDIIGPWVEPAAEPVKPAEQMSQREMFAELIALFQKSTEPQPENPTVVRDYFAGQALAGLCSGLIEDAPYDVIAKDAYGVADAMMAARQKGQTND